MAKQTPKKAKAPAARPSSARANALALPKPALPSVIDAKSAFDYAREAATRAVFVYFTPSEQEYIIEHRVPLLFCGVEQAVSPTYGEKYDVLLRLRIDGEERLRRWSFPRNAYRDEFFKRMTEVMIASGGEPLPGWRVRKIPTTKGDAYDLVPLDYEDAEAEAGERPTLRELRVIVPLDAEAEEPE